MTNDSARNNRLVSALIAVGLTSSPGLYLLACSSDGGSGVPTTTGGTDSGAKSDGSSSGDSSTTGSDSGSSDAGAAADCGKSASLHPSDGGIYCPFSASDGGKNVYCTKTEQCCESAKGSTSTCEAKGAACPGSGSTAWECEAPNDCPSGQQCCAHALDGGSVTVGQDTCGPYLSHFAGTRCATTCGAGELVVCEANGDCAGGASCTAVKPKANDIGVCQ